jgi:hypothetical protein
VIANGCTYVVSAEDSHHFAASIELDEDALFEVLYRVRFWELSSALFTHLLEFWLCLRHLDDSRLL